MYIQTGALGLLLLATPQLIGQTAAKDTFISSDQLMWLLVFTMIVVAIVCLLLTVTIFYLIRDKKTATTTSEATEGATTGTIAVTEGAQGQVKEALPWMSWAFIQKKLTRAVPVAQEEDIDLGHDYDGIRELDNALPPWWKWGFYITIGFAVVYLWYFHIATDWSSNQEYEQQMARAESAKAAYLEQVANNVDETNAVLLTDASDLQIGKEIYTTNCVACHGEQGQGGVGPNFADPYWIHGGDIKDLFELIKYGVPEKGMIAWQDQLRPTEIQQVASYILQFQGTNPPNAKEPQGELYTPSETPSDSTTAPADTASTLTMR